MTKTRFKLWRISAQHYVNGEQIYFHIYLDEAALPEQSSRFTWNLLLYDSECVSLHKKVPSYVTDVG